MSCCDPHVNGTSSGAGASSAPGPRWEFDAGTADADPGSGKWRYNNATQSASTFIFINDSTLDAVGFIDLFTKLATNDLAYPQSAERPASNKLWKLTGAATNAVNYFKLPIAAALGAPGSDFVAGQTVRFLFQVADGGGGGGSLAFTPTKTANYTAAAGELVKFDPTSATFTLTFPAAPVANARVGFKNVSTSTRAITLDGNGNTVEDPASYAVAATVLVGGNGLDLTYQYNGTSWLIV